MLPANRKWWESCLYPQPKQVLDLATPERCKAELTYVTWKWTGRKLNPRPVNRKFNALPLSHHATLYCDFDQILKFRAAVTTPFADQSQIWHPKLNPWHILFHAKFNLSSLQGKKTILTKLWNLGAPVLTSITDQSLLNLACERIRSTLNAYMSNVIWIYLLCRHSEAENPQILTSTFCDGTTFHLVA